MAHSRGTGLTREGPQDGTRKAWLLLVSVSSHPLRVQSESHAGRHADDGGVVRLPRFTGIAIWKVFT